LGTNVEEIPGGLTPLLCLGTGGNFFLALAINYLSTILNDLNPRSICHCKYAAIMPLASRLNFISEASAVSQSPVINADIKEIVAGAGTTEPGGRHSSQVAPPALTEKALCGPSAPQRAHS
jgi:hypothetical protein